MGVQLRADHIVVANTEDFLTAPSIILPLRIHLDGDFSDIPPLAE